MGAALSNMKANLFGLGLLLMLIGGGSAFIYIWLYHGECISLNPFTVLGCFSQGTTSVVNDMGHGIMSATVGSSFADEWTKAGENQCSWVDHWYTIGPGNACKLVVALSHWD